MGEGLKNARTVGKGLQLVEVVGEGLGNVRLVTPLAVCLSYQLKDSRTHRSNAESKLDTGLTALCLTPLENFYHLALSNKGVTRFHNDLQCLYFN